jgi:hypothetical protein
VVRDAELVEHSEHDVAHVVGALDLVTEVIDERNDPQAEGWRLHGALDGGGAQQLAGGDVALLPARSQGVAILASG